MNPRTPSKPQWCDARCNRSPNRSLQAMMRSAPPQTVSVLSWINQINKKSKTKQKRVWPNMCIVPVIVIIVIVIVIVFVSFNWLWFLSYAMHSGNAHPTFICFRSIYMYVQQCVCVCVCVPAHTHTHAHPSGLVYKYVSWYIIYIICGNCLLPNISVYPQTLDIAQ